MLATVPVEEARCLLRGLSRAAQRRKALDPEGLPSAMMAGDGKHVATDVVEGDQRAQDQAGRHVVQTLTGAVVYSSSNLFRVVSVDTGMTSETKARLIVDECLDYPMALGENQLTLLDETVCMLGRLPRSSALAEARTWAGSELVTRHLRLNDEIAGYHGWSCRKRALRVESERLHRDGNGHCRGDRYLVTGLGKSELGRDQWLHLVCVHWRVEHDVHKTFDVALREHEHAWFRDPHWTLVAKLLRRIAYAFLALYRTVSLDGEIKGFLPGNELLAWTRTALVATSRATSPGYIGYPAARRPPTTSPD